MKKMRIAAGFMVLAMTATLSGCDRILPPRATAMTTEATVATTEITTKPTKATSETIPTSTEPKTPTESLVGIWIGANYNSYPGGILEFKEDGSFVYRELRKKAKEDVDPNLEIRTSYKSKDKDEHTCTVDLSASGDKKFKQLECKVDGHKLRITGLPYAAEGMYFDFFNNNIDSAPKSRDTQLYGEWVFTGKNNKKVANTEDERLEIYEDNTAKYTSYLPNDKKKENRGKVDLLYNVEYNWDGGYMLILWDKVSGNLYKVYDSYLLTTTKVRFFTLVDPISGKMTSQEFKHPLPSLEDTTTPVET
jgi:hypothetical protein